MKTYQSRMQLRGNTHDASPHDPYSHPGRFAPRLADMLAYFYSPILPF